MQRQGRPRKLVHGNFFSVTPAISTSDKPHNEFCPLNRRCARSQSQQPSHHLNPAYPQRTHTLASSPQLFPFSHIHPTGPAGTGAASDNQSTHPRGDASLTSLTQTHADRLPKGAGIRAEAGSPRRPGRGHATIFAHAQQELPSQHKRRASGARG